MDLEKRGKLALIGMCEDRKISTKTEVFISVPDKKRKYFDRGMFSHVRNAFKDELVERLELIF